jgi:ABC-2 type transport system ATP-binding protein
MMNDALATSKKLTNLFGLEKIIRQPVSQYSRGSRQKVAFIAAMISNPQLLVIDEPIVGLDPGSIDVFGNELLEYVKKGGTVLLATHILPFAAKYADRVAVMYNGQIVIERLVTENTNLERIYELAMES